MTKKWKKIEEDIIRFFNGNPNQQLKGRELAGKLGVSSRDYQAFKRQVRRLADEGRLSRYKGNRFGASRKSNDIDGILHVKTQGYGFVRREGESEDVFISQRNMGAALHLDRVRVLLWARPVGKLAEGKVVEILERGRKRIVGTFQVSGKFSYVVPDELKLTRDVVVGKEDRKNAKSGDKVSIEITNWGDGRRLPEGKVVEVIGTPGEKGVDVLSVIHAFELPVRFPPKVEKETAEISSDIRPEDLKNRLDLRDNLIFTIDPDDAKDFDDAVSLEVLPNSNYSLGVHIADVSHFVESGSAVDGEALKRGTSVYLVDRVIPMLPERLSNSLCSLRPDEDHLTYSVTMEVSPNGDVLDYRIKESVIRSKIRFTYKEVQFLMDHLDKKTQDPDQEHSKIKGEVFPRKDLLRDKDLQKALANMIELSRILRKRRYEAGSIPFDAPEPRVVLDKKGFPVELGVREHSESHELIEEFMILANRTVAEHIDRLRKEGSRKYPFVYRIHEKPDGKKLSDFVNFVRALGYSFDPGRQRKNFSDCWNKSPDPNMLSSWKRLPCAL